jgi:uncharacterized membrane protein YhaH (DUF805 family)
MSMLSLLWSFKGRINRAKFWLGILLANLLLLAVALLSVFVDAMTGGNGEQLSGPAEVAMWVGSFAWAASVLAIHVKRWHDLDKSGWLVLLLFVPLIGPIWALVDCGCLEGTRGQNAHGPDPLEGSGPTLIRERSGRPQSRME